MDNKIQGALSKSSSQSSVLHLQQSIKQSNDYLKAIIKNHQQETKKLNQTSTSLKNSSKLPQITSPQLSKKFKQSSRKQRSQDETDFSSKKLRASSELQNPLNRINPKQSQNLEKLPQMSINTRQNNNKRQMSQKSFNSVQPPQSNKFDRQRSSMSSQTTLPVKQQHQIAQKISQAAYAAKKAREIAKQHQDSLHKVKEQQRKWVENMNQMQNILSLQKKRRMKDQPFNQTENNQQWIRNQYMQQEDYQNSRGFTPFLKTSNHQIQDNYIYQIQQHQQPMYNTIKDPNNNRRNSSQNSVFSQENQAYHNTISSHYYNHQQRRMKKPVSGRKSKLQPINFKSQSPPRPNRQSPRGYGNQDRIYDMKAVTPIKRQIISDHRSQKNPEMFKFSRLNNRNETLQNHGRNSKNYMKSSINTQSRGYSNRGLDSFRSVSNQPKRRQEFFTPNKKNVHSYQQSAYQSYRKKFRVPLSGGVKFYPASLKKSIIHNRLNGSKNSPYYNRASNTNINDNYSEDQIPSDFSVDFSSAGTTNMSNPSSHERRLINAKVIGAGSQKVRVGALSHSPARMRAAGGALHFSKHSQSSKKSDLMILKGSNTGSSVGGSVIFQNKSKKGPKFTRIMQPGSGLFPGEKDMRPQIEYQHNGNGTLPGFLPPILASSDEKLAITGSQHLITSGLPPTISKQALMINRGSPDPEMQYKNSQISRSLINQEDQSNNNQDPKNMQSLFSSQNKTIRNSNTNPRKKNNSQLMSNATIKQQQSAFEQTYEHQNPAIFQLRDENANQTQTQFQNLPFANQNRQETPKPLTIIQSEREQKTPHSQKATPPTKQKNQDLQSHKNIHEDIDLQEQLKIVNESRNNFQKGYQYRLNYQSKNNLLIVHSQKRNKRLPQIKLLKSVFKYRVPTLFFQYSPDINPNLKSEKRVEYATNFMLAHYLHRGHDFSEDEDLNDDNNNNTINSRFQQKRLSNSKSKKKLKTTSKNSGTFQKQKKLQVVKSQARMFFKYSEDTQIYNVILDTLFSAGLELISNTSSSSHLSFSNAQSQWNLNLCSQCRGQSLQFLKRGQKVNHFPGSHHLLGVKDALWRNIQPYCKQFGSAQFGFLPQTYILPDQHHRFQMNRDSSNLWILKPASLSCGKGIRLIGRRSQVDKLSNFIIQKYIFKPHLINGFKYDLRVYVAVTSFDPLKIYMYEEGLVRFATQKYSTNPRHLSHQFMHLTNFSVNQKNTKSFHANQGDFSGSKWTLNMLKRIYITLGIDINTVFSRIKDIIVKTLISVSSPITYQIKRFYKHSSITNNPCFELYGFDVLIDQKLYPWLLEVNTGPSLSCPSDLDRNVKYSLVNDLFTLVGMKVNEITELYQQFDGGAKQFNLNEQSKIGCFPKRQSPLAEKQLEEVKEEEDDAINSTNEEIKNSINMTEQEYFQMTERRKSKKKAKALELLNSLTSGQLEVIMQYEQQTYRKGKFERIFPIEQNFHHYSRFFNWQGAEHESFQVASGLQRLGIKVIPDKSQNKASYRKSPGNSALWKYLKTCLESTGEARGKIQRFSHKISHERV